MTVGEQLLAEAGAELGALIALAKRDTDELLDTIEALDRDTVDMLLAAMVIIAGSPAGAVELTRVALDAWPADG